MLLTVVQLCIFAVIGVLDSHAARSVCPTGFYGDNCNQLCGHCRYGTCNITTGLCDPRDACELWYAPKDTCHLYVTEELSLVHIWRVQIIDKSSRMVRLHFEQLETEFLLSPYYIYKIQYASIHMAAFLEYPDVIKTRIEGGLVRQPYIYGLQPNTYYRFRIALYRIHASRNASQLIDISNVSVTSTLCEEPEKPVITEAMIFASLRFVLLRWQAIQQSGCKSIKQLTIQYRESSRNWTDVMVPSTMKEYTLGGDSDTLQAGGSYVIRLVVTNDQGLQSSSESLQINIPSADTEPDQRNSERKSTGTEGTEQRFRGLLVACVVLTILSVTVSSGTILYIKLRKAKEQKTGTGGGVEATDMDESPKMDESLVRNESSGTLEASAESNSRESTELVVRNEVNQTTTEENNKNKESESVKRYEYIRVFPGGCITADGVGGYCRCSAASVTHVSPELPMPNNRTPLWSHMSISERTKEQNVTFRNGAKVSLKSRSVTSDGYLIPCDGYLVTADGYSSTDGFLIPVIRADLTRANESEARDSFRDKNNANNFGAKILPETENPTHNATRDSTEEQMTCGEEKPTQRITSDGYLACSCQHE